MTLTDIFCPLAEIFLFCILVATILRRDKTLNQQIFTVMVFSVFGVLVFQNLIFVLHGYGLATLMERVAFVFACLAFGSFAAFSITYPNNPFELRPRTVALMYLPFLLLAPTSFVGDITIIQIEIVNGIMQRRDGPLYLVFGALAGVSIVSVVLLGILKNRREKNPYYKLQLRYEIFSLVMPGIIGVVSTVLLPLLLGDTSFFRIGPHIAVVVCIAALFYASQSSQLLDLNAFARKLYLYGLLGLALFVPPLVLIRLSISFLVTWPENVRIFLLLSGMFGFTFYYRLLHNLLRGFIERREKEMKLAAERFAAELESTNDKREMARRTVNFLMSMLKLEHAEFLVFQEESRAFDLVAASDPDDLAQQLSTNETLDRHSHDWLFKIFMLGEEVIYRDMLGVGNTSAGLDASDVAFLAEFMRDGRFYVLVALKFNNRLLGFAALGRKVERKPFSLAELRLLQQLRQDLSIALSNALMYSSLIEKVNEMNTLNRLAIENQDKHTRASVIEMVCEVLSQRLPFERISYFSVEFVEQALIMSYSTSKNLFVPALSKRTMIKLGDGPIGNMVMRRTEICENHLFRTPREQRSEIERWLECSCYAMIPIAHSGVPVGVLLVENFDQKAEIRRDTMRYLSLLSQHIGSLLENFEMYHDIKEQVASLKIVTEAAFAMTGSLDIDKVTREVLHIIKKTFNLQHAGVFFYNSGHDILHKGIAIAASPKDEKLFSRLKFHGSDEGNPFQAALQNKEPVIEDDVRKISHKLIRSAALRWGKGMGIFPVTVRNTAIAVFVLSFDSDKRRLSQDFQSVIGSLTRFYATALENARSFHKVETINANLERLVEDRTREAESERKKSDSLLLNILPKEIADDLKVSGESKPTYYADVTVLFTDFVGFTQIAESMSAEELVGELNVCFRAFDAICEKHHLEKLKTIGDAYMAAGGLPLPNDTHPADVVAAALDIVSFMEDLQRRKSLEGKPFWELRCGVHTGPVVAGVIGSKKFAYDIWGDIVNMASRMELSGVKGKVNISSETFERVRDVFACEHRGQVEAKRKGKVDMYLVLGRI